MTLPEQYAKALHELITRDATNSAAYLSNLKTLLDTKGHLKLLPEIFGAYTKIIDREKRLQRNAEVSPQEEKTRVLLELYRTLVQTPN